MKLRRLIVFVWVGLLLAACGTRAAKNAAPTLTDQPPTLPATAAIVQAAAISTATPTLPATPRLPTATPTKVFALCSPLEGISISELGLPDLLKNPFQPPRPGMDDGHHGDDFAYWSRGDRKTMLGLPVYSVFNGQVAAVIHNRQPYGNAIIIETALETLPVEWVESIPIPTPAPTVPPAPNLRCPPDQTNYATQSGRSLYLLYAHLNQPPNLANGETVACGQAIGEVGTTGKSVNPHLHLETRVGPAGATFASLSHYDTSSSDAEMSAYCTWRVSGLFQMFDPMTLLK